MKKEDIQHYINNFRRELSIYLKPDFNLKAIIYPAIEGAIIELEFRKDQPTKDEFRKSENTLGEQLDKINQKIFAGNSNGLKFSGTNIFLEPGKIIIIKDSNDTEWSISKAKEDVEKLLKPQS